MRLLLLVLTLISVPAVAQHANHGDHAPSPYAADADRAIKALSADEVDGLLGGQGLGLARAAELNSYPGPLHALELADSLGLDATQRAETARIRTAMTAEAQALGEQIVDAEGHLDALFSDGHATDDAVDRMTAHIGALRGRLRATHLRAHVALAGVLTEEQRAAYDRLRGYTSD